MASRSVVFRSCAAFLFSLAVPAVALAQTTGGGRGALRPYVHIFLAYGAAWILILVWVWLIARGLKRVTAGLENTGHHGT